MRFLTLRKSGSASVNGSTGLFANGTAAAPSISFSSDSDTGFYRRGANELGFATGGVLNFWMTRGTGVSYLIGPVFNNALNLLDSGAISLVAAGTNQNITLTPSTTGMIDGVFASNGISGIRVSNTNGGASAYAVGYFGTTATPTDVVIGCVGTGNSAYGGANSGFVGTNGNKAFAFLTNGAEVARFHANGRLGLGTGATDSGNGILQLATHTTSAGGIGFGTDTSLYRVAAQTLALQGSTQPGIQLYRGATLACFFDATSTQVRFGSQEAAQSTLIHSGNAVALTLDSSQNATFAGFVAIPSSSIFYFISSTKFSAPSNGVMLLQNNAGTDFTRLQFGGTTSSFPSIKRTGAQFDLLLADESDFTTVRLANVRAVRAAATASAGEVAYGGTTATTVGAAGGASLLPATPLGYIIVNVAGTAAKIPYYNS